MSTYWTTFARSGGPNTADLPEWRPYTRREEPAMELGDNIRLVNHVRGEKLDLLEGLLEKRMPAGGK